MQSNQAKRRAEAAGDAEAEEGGELARRLLLLSE